MRSASRTFRCIRRSGLDRVSFPPLADIDQWPPLGFIRPMEGERNQMGRLIDPAERYHEFLLGLYDLEAEAIEEAYCHVGIDQLHEARIQFLEAFRRLY